MTYIFSVGDTNSTNRCRNGFDRLQRPVILLYNYQIWTSSFFISIFLASVQIVAHFAQIREALLHCHIITEANNISSNLLHFQTEQNILSKMHPLQLVSQNLDYVQASYGIT